MAHLIITQHTKGFEYKSWRTCNWCNPVSVSLTDSFSRLLTPLCPWNLITKVREEEMFECRSSTSLSCRYVKRDYLPMGREWSGRKKGSWADWTWNHSNQLNGMMYITKWPYYGTWYTVEQAIKLTYSVLFAEGVLVFFNRSKLRALLSKSPYRILRISPLIWWMHSCRKCKAIWQ